MAQYISIPRAVAAPFEVIPVALANGLKTVLQIKPVTKDLRVVCWGISGDGSAAGAPFQAELLDCDVAATVTSLSPDPYDNEDAVAALAVGGTAATGYNASAEGTLTAARIFDSLKLPVNGAPYVNWFPLGQMGKIAAGRFLRIRTRYTATTVNVIPYVIFDEV